VWSTSAGPRWSAEARPDADLVTLAREDGATAWMVFALPRSVAWAGRSLVVTTTGGEPLLFPNLVSTLDGL
jgi:hypothetical protein